MGSLLRILIRSLNIFWWSWVYLKYVESLIKVLKDVTSWYGLMGVAAKCISLCQIIWSHTVNELMLLTESCYCCQVVIAYSGILRSLQKHCKIAKSSDYFAPFLSSEHRMIPQRKFRWTSHSLATSFRAPPLSLILVIHIITAESGEVFDNL